jgi:uroporphyrin-III C-methyltransferase / precorrin-2 dehydrogenase / sirohydrochlorin ferrochelatase
MLALPLSLPLDNRLVILIGEGDVLQRKLKLIEKTPADILIFSGVDNDFPKAESLDQASLVIIAFDNKIKAQASLNHIRAINPKSRYILNVVDQPDLSDVHIPAIIERGPLSIGIGTGGVTPTLARRLRAQIEAILPNHLGQLAKACQLCAATIREAVADPAKRRKLWEQLLDGPWAKAVENNDLEAATIALNNAIEGHGAQKGEVILMGAGPGHAGLLTLDGLRALIDADVIIYDRLVSDEVLGLGRRDADYVYVGKQSAHHSLPQEEIVSLLITEARQGKRVVRLKGGDPLVFGRGGEEIDGLKAAGIEVRIIAGITTAQALAASAQIALTHRSWAHGLSLLTAHAKDNQKGKSGLMADDFQNRGVTKIIYMGIETAPDWVETAIGSGMSLKSPILIGTNIAKDNQVLRLTTLGELVSALRLDPPDGPSVFILDGVMNGFPKHKEKALK